MGLTVVGAALSRTPSFQALPSCTEEVAFGRSSDGTGQSAGSHEGVPEGTRIHVARGAAK